MMVVNKIVVCTFLVVLATLYADAREISCKSHAGKWCTITATALDLKAENDIVLDNTSHKNKVTHFKWLKRSNMKNIPTIIFETFPNLWHVSLSTGLQTLHKSCFTNAKKLTHLSLEKNSIRNLTEGVFSNARNLKAIDLNENRIRAIENFAFKNLDKLQYLYLAENMLTTITHNSLKGAPNLLVINFDNNRITTIEPGAFDMQHLKNLVLPNNGLLNIPADLFSKAPSLQVVDLLYNDFYEIPTALLKCGSLRKLILDWMNLQDADLPKLAEVKGLKTLSLGNCDLHDISSFKRVDDSSIESLDLMNNRLYDEDLLMKLTGFKSLKTLILDENDLTRLNGMEELMTMFPNLTSISLKKNAVDCTWINDIEPMMKVADIDIDSDCDST